MRFKIYGLSQEDDYLHFNGDCPYQSIMLAETFLLDDNLADLKNLNQIIINPEVMSYKEVNKGLLNKLIIKGRLNLHILYSSLDRNGSNHTTDLSKEFHLSMEIPDYISNISETDINILVEDIDYQIVTCRKIKFNLLLFSYLQC